MVREPDFSPEYQTRLTLIAGVLGILLVALVLRLAYWQILQGDSLQASAASQYQRLYDQHGQRGRIFTSDGYVLAGTETRYRLFVEPPKTTQPLPQITSLVAPLIWEHDLTWQAATESAIKEERQAHILSYLESRITRPDAKWLALWPMVGEQTKTALEQLQIAGLGFEPYLDRSYPEASAAAQLLGFVGHREDGSEQGYFGVEGKLHHELKGRTIDQVVNADALGRPLFGSRSVTPTELQGRDVVLTVRRDIQLSVEQLLSQAVERYGAKSGEVIVMEPQTGKILALATWPVYDPDQFNTYPAELYRNPAVSSAYEPGSTLKTLTLAAGIDAGVITADTICPVCAGPRIFGRFTLRTWNQVYNPDITMREALAKSDNTAMIYVSDLLGSARLREYLEKFGLSDPSGIELEEDGRGQFPQRWGEVETATVSFGQGISATTLQVTKAVAALANRGTVMRPHLVEKVIDHQRQQEVLTQPQVVATVVSPQTAQTMTELMVYAAEKGEAQWTASPKYLVAGKTGTSQIAEDGSYATDKTIASFIGFAPADQPRFIMMVKLVEPTTSPWAAETAAPLWYQIAEKLYLHLNLPPDK